MSPDQKTVFLVESKLWDKQTLAFTSPTPSNHVYPDGINFKIINQQGQEALEEIALQAEWEGCSLLQPGRYL